MTEPRVLVVSWWCLLGGLSCQAGESGAPPATTSRTPTATAETGAGFSLDIRSTRECAPEAHTTLAPDEYLLGVEVEVEARSEGVPQNYYYGTLIGGDGQSYRAGFAGCEPRLSGKPLLRGQRAKGYVNFRLPRSAKDLTLEYDPPTLGSDKRRGPKVQRKLGR